MCVALLVLAAAATAAAAACCRHSVLTCASASSWGGTRSPTTVALVCAILLPDAGQERYSSMPRAPRRRSELQALSSFCGFKRCTLRSENSERRAAAHRRVLLLPLLAAHAANRQLNDVQERCRV